MGKHTNQLRTAVSALLILVTAVSIGCGRSRPPAVITTPTPTATANAAAPTPAPTMTPSGTTTPIITPQATPGPTPTVMAAPTPVATPTPTPTAGLKTLTVDDKDLPKPPVDGLTVHFLKPARGDYGPGKIRASFGALSYSVWFSVAEGKLGLYHLPKRENLPQSLAAFYDYIGVDQYATFAEERSYWVVVGGRSFKVNAESVNKIVAAEVLTQDKPLLCALTGQPDVPRNIRIAITDGDASISAFSIAVVGIDAQGRSNTETFVFAGGLTQIGSIAFEKITSVTVSSMTGAGAGDLLNVGIGPTPGADILYDNFSNLATGKQVTVTFLEKNGENVAISFESNDSANQGQGDQPSPPPPATLRFRGTVEGVVDLWINGIPPWLNISRYDPEITGAPTLVSVAGGDGTATVSYVIK